MEIREEQELEKCRITRLRGGMNKFYLASPLFTVEQQKRIREVAEILRSKNYEVYVPMEHTVDNAYGLPNAKWAKAVFDEDIRALEECNTVIMIYDGLYSDSGTA